MLNNFAMSGNINDPNMSAGKVSDLWTIRTQSGAISSVKWRSELPIKTNRKTSFTIYAAHVMVDMRQHSHIKTNKALKASAGKDFDTAAFQPLAVTELEKISEGNELYEIMSPD